MKLISVTGENVPPSKGGSPADTFDRSIATWEADGKQKTITVTYVRYFAKVLAEQGVYDQDKEGVPVNRLAAVLFAEKYPQAQGSRHYINSADEFLALFEGFSLEKWKQRYPAIVEPSLA